MARNLYRFYLYVVFVAFLIFAAVAIERLLSTVLLLTPLRYYVYTSLPSSAAIVQVVVFAVVSLLISGILGGLHYWLIQRDIQHDPDAVNSGIRAFFLNFGVAVGVLSAVPTIGFEIFYALGNNSGVSAVSGIAVGISILGVVLLLVLEQRRNRVTATAGPALAFQRIHLYVVQIFLLAFLSFIILTTFRPFVTALFFGSKGMPQDCNFGCGSTHNFVFLAVTLLWFGVCWAAYGLLTIGDRSVWLRLICHCVSFAYGVIFIMIGVYQLLNFSLAPLFNLSVSLHDVLGSDAQYDFISPLALGLLVVGVYHLWLRKAAQRGLMGKSVVSLTELTIVALLAAAAFWWGCGYTLYDTLQYLMPTPNVPASSVWRLSIVLVSIGLAYIPLDLYLRRRSMVDVSAAGLRRGLVLALLGSGILALASGGSTALYTWVTASFGSPIDNWQRVAQGGLATFLIGALLIGFYLSSAMRERLIARPAKQTEAPKQPEISDPATPVAPTEETIEATLDELLSGNITRNEAASRIRALSTTSISSAISILATLCAAALFY